MPHRPIGVTAARLMLRRQPIKNPLLSEGDIAFTGEKDMRRRQTGKRIHGAEAMTWRSMPA
jgi:hypothetical protein